MHNILAVRLGSNGDLPSELARIDAQSIRPIRAILDAQAAGRTAAPADLARLAELQSLADGLRAQLRA